MFQQSRRNVISFGAESKSKSDDDDLYDYMRKGMEEDKRLCTDKPAKTAFQVSKRKGSVHTRRLSVWTLFPVPVTHRTAESVSQGHFFFAHCPSLLTVSSFEI